MLMSLLSDLLLSLQEKKARTENLLYCQVTEIALLLVVLFLINTGIREYIHVNSNTYSVNLHTLMVFHCLVLVLMLNIGLLILLLDPSHLKDNCFS